MENIIRDYEVSDFWNFIGFELEEMKEGNVTLRLPIKSNLLNVSKSVHGGVYASILDTAMGISARTLGFDAVTTLEMDVHFLKGIDEGTMYAVGNVIHQNRSTVLMEAHLFDENDNKLAHSIGTFRVEKH